MANKYTAYPMPEKSVLTELYESGMNQKEVGNKLGVSQKVIFGWFKKLGIKSRMAKKRNQYGKNNSSWKGDNATYAALHYRVERLRGKPKVCSKCETTDATKYEWASLTKNYADPYDYIRLCKSCHATFDRIINNITKQNK